VAPGLQSAAPNSTSEPHFKPSLSELPKAEQVLLGGAACMHAYGPPGQARPGKAEPGRSAPSAAQRSAAPHTLPAPPVLLPPGPCSPVSSSPRAVRPSWPSRSLSPSASTGLPASARPLQGAGAGGLRSSCSKQWPLAATNTSVRYARAPFCAMAQGCPGVRSPC
jgi:hypothetical protein